MDLWRLRLRNGSILRDGFKTRLEAIQWHNSWLDSQNYENYTQEQFDAELWCSIECYCPDDSEPNGKKA